MTEQSHPHRIRNTVIGVISGVVFGALSFIAMFFSQFLVLVILMVGLVVATVSETVVFVYVGLALLQVLYGWWVGWRHAGTLARLARKLILRGIGILLLLFLVATVASFFFLESTR